MRISLVYFEGCPHWRLAGRRLMRAIEDAGVGSLAIDAIPVATLDEAIQFGLRGSPTILIGGIDPFGDPGVPAGLSCRIFATEHGPDGAPSVTQLVDALRSACDVGLDERDVTDAASFPASDPPEAGAPGL